MALSAVSIVCRWWRNKTTLVCVLLMLITSCNQHTAAEKETLPFYNNADFDAVWIRTEDPAYKQIHTIDTFSLVNQLGNTITKKDLDGTIYVANFFFTTCPGICPKMAINLRALQDSFVKDPQVRLVSFSVMPWVDSVARLKKYAEENEVNPGKWWLLTGDKEKIYSLGRRSYFAEKELGLQKNNSEFLHTESMLLIDTKGRIRGIYNTTQKPDLERVSEDIKLLLEESKNATKEG